MTAAYRCSVASQELEEAIEGTASTVRAFLLVEAPGPWGVDALRDSRLPPSVKGWLADLASRHRVRPLLIRRHGAGQAGGTRVFAASVHTDEPWAETVTLGDVRELLELDPTGLGEGRSIGLTPHEEPLFLVCTHGRHDACCAERGRPVAAAMTQAAPEQTWEVSHIGGDRFAANLLVLPHGLYYGRLTPEHAPAFAASHLDGRLDLEHLRGRSSYPFPVQAAEIYLRRHLDRDEIAPLTLEQHSREGSETSAIFSVGGSRWEVRVGTGHGEQRRLTCRAASLSAGFSHRLIGVAEL